MLAWPAVLQCRAESPTQRVPPGAQRCLGLGWPLA